MKTQLVEADKGVLRRLIQAAQRGGAVAVHAFSETALEKRGFEPPGCQQVFFVVTNMLVLIFG
jgi:hypothetical protein